MSNEPTSPGKTSLAHLSDDELRRRLTEPGPGEELYLSEVAEEERQRVGMVLLKAWAEAEPAHRAIQAMSGQAELHWIGEFLRSGKAGQAFLNLLAELFSPTKSVADAPYRLALVSRTRAEVRGEITAKQIAARLERQGKSWKISEILHSALRAGESIEAAVSEAAAETGLARSTIFQMMAEIKGHWMIYPDDGPADASGEG